MKHTLQSLLPLLDTPEGLEKLRIITAEADGWTVITWEELINPRIARENKQYCKNNDVWRCEWLPNYTLSLDAIFAAEERLGLHDRDKEVTRQSWYLHVSGMLDILDQERLIEELAFLTAAQRCIPFILTAQEVRPS